MKKNNSKGRIHFLIFGYLTMCIVAAAMIYFDDKVLEELTSVRDVLFDGSGAGNSNLVPVGSVNFETYVEHHHKSRVSFQKDENIYKHNNTQAAYMQNMAGNLSESSPVFSTVALVENNVNYSTSKQLAKASKKDLAQNSIPKFLNGKKSVLTSAVASADISQSDAVSDNEIFASQVIQRSTSDVSPSGDPEGNAIPVGDSYWFLAILLLCYTWRKHSSSTEKKVILKVEL